MKKYIQRPLKMGSSPKILWPKQQSDVTIFQLLTIKVILN